MAAGHVLLDFVEKKIGNQSRTTNGNHCPVASLSTGAFAVQNGVCGCTN